MPPAIHQNTATRSSMASTARPSPQQSRVMQCRHEGSTGRQAVRSFLPAAAAAWLVTLFMTIKRHALDAAYVAAGFQQPGLYNHGSFLHYTQRCLTFQVVHGQHRRVHRNLLQRSTQSATYLHQGQPEATTNRYGRQGVGVAVGERHRAQHRQTQCAVWQTHSHNVPLEALGCQLWRSAAAETQRGVPIRLLTTCSSNSAGVMHRKHLPDAVTHQATVR